MAGPWEAQPSLSMHGPRDDAFGRTANESPGLNCAYRARRSMVLQFPDMMVTMISQRVHSRIKEAVDLRQGPIHGSINRNRIGRRFGRALERRTRPVIYNL